MDETFDTSFEVRFPKIQQISEAQVSQPDISQNLLCVNREQCLNRFEFEQNPFFNNQISSITIIEEKFIIKNRY